MRDHSHSHHPKVEARGNSVTLEVRGNHDYYGHLYVGKKYDENRMIFDTMSHWTTVNDEQAVGVDGINYYKVSDSETAHVQYKDPLTKTVDS